MGLNLLYTKPEPTPAPTQFGQEDVPRTLFGYAKPIRLRWFTGLVVAVVAVSLDLAIPQILSFIIDELLANHPSHAMVWLGGGLVVAVGLLRMVLVWVRRSLLIDPSSTIETQMRMSLFDKLMRSPIAFHDRWPGGQLLQRTMADLGSVRRWLAFGIVQSIAIAFMLVVGSVLLARGSVLLTGLYLASVPFILVSLFFFVRKFRRLTRESQELASNISTTVEESVQGIRVLKALGRGDHAHQGFTRQSEELKDLEIQRAQTLGSVFVRNFIIMGVTMVITLVVGIHQVADGGMSVGELTAYFATVVLLNAQVERTGMILSMGLTAKVAMDRHREIIETPDDEDNHLLAAEPADLPSAAASLEFKNVSFTYADGNKPVLKDFSLAVKPGEIIALVGATGSGKSTALQLVPKLYSASSGHILLDGTDINELTLPQLRANMAFAFEEPVLFSASIRENVLLGLDTSALSEVQADRLVNEALAASAASFVEDLPDGVHSQVGEEGMSLSGGQRQRLSLARAIAMNPRVLLLDDPLSALDVTTEQFVVEQLKARLTNTTTLLTAHRPSTVTLADRVAVMQDGAIVAVDTPSAIKSNPVYRELMSNEEADHEL